jgi:carbonic anhydrase/acetyltransferase-like protein (isoleucine patch superfamily)
MQDKIATPSWVLARHHGTKNEDWKPLGKGWVHINATVGNGATVGDRATVGDWATVGNGAKVGDGARVGNWAMVGDRATVGNGAKVGDGARVGDGATFNQSPIYIQGTRHFVCHYAPRMMSIGCVNGTLDWWTEHIDETGIEYGYTDDEIAEYRRYLALMIEHDAHVFPESQ